jgi:hypothetical protein
MLVTFDVADTAMQKRFDIVRYAAVFFTKLLCFCAQMSRFQDGGCYVGVDNVDYGLTSLDLAK